MKRFLILILGLALSLIMSACGNNYTDGYCGECGGEVFSTDKFCRHCGISINKEPEVHTHSYSDATCSEPATCSCGLTEGSVLEHSWGEWHENAETPRNLCTEDGVELRICDSCGNTEERAVYAAHDYAEGYCTRCNDRDETYDFVYIDFNDKLFEGHIKQALGIEAGQKVATVDMKRLTSIKVQKRVSDIEELKYATNLNKITIEANNIKNLNVLIDRPLTDVTLGTNGEITEIDVSFMRSLKQVERVYFYDCRLTGGTMKDVVSSPILKYYKTFINYMSDETDGNIDYLTGANSIEELSLWNDFEQRTDVSVLKTLPNLKKLELHITGYPNDDFSKAQYVVFDELVINGVVVSFK